MTPALARQSIPQRLYLALVYALLYIPLGVLILYSINNARFSLRWHGVSFQWYQELLHDRELWQAFTNSVTLGALAACFATLIGLFTCVHLFLQRKSDKNSTLFGLLLLLVIIPDLVLGVSLLILFNLCNLSLGFYSLLIAHITFCIPFAVMSIINRMNTIDRTIYYSALDLGASPLYAMKTILLPLLWPGVLSAFLLSFTLSFDDVIISYFVAGADFTILPLTIYSLVRAGVTPELNALCTVTFLLSVLLVVISHWLSRKST